nr:putative nucleotidyltransferase, ribonuclease H [Tanacetum cinerariifolium]
MWKGLGEVQVYGEVPGEEKAIVPFWRENRVEFRVDDDGVMWFGDRLCVPSDPTLREVVLSEAHISPFSIHLGSTKMYGDLKQHFWWNGMKRDIATLADIFHQEIVRLHGTLATIVSDRDLRFTSRFWKGLQSAWGTRLKFSTTFYPETDGQTERTIQTLEDMLRSCALEWTGNWDEYLCLVEFAYNNSLHASITAAPYELLYRRKCRAPICWNEVGERVIEGPELIKVTNEKVVVAKEKLKEARGVQRFRIKGKLSPRFNGPFEILDHVGEVSYRLALPPQLSHVHNVFYVSLLRGYKYHPLHVVSYSLDQIREDLSLAEEPEKILDR